MSSPAKVTGAEFLVRRSDVAKSRRDMATLRDILIVEDRKLDAERMVATLHTMLGYSPVVRRANTLSSALDEMLKQKPDLILLDDRLVSEDANESIPMLRRVPFEGPIIVISGHMDRLRRIEVMKMGADEALNKDDVDSVEIAAILTRLGVGEARPVDAPDKG